MYKNIIRFIIIVVILLLVFGGCKNQIKDKIITSLGGYTQVTYKQSVDTLISKFDSIYIEYDSVRTYAELGEQRLLSNYKLQIDKNKHLSQALTKALSKGKIVVTNQIGVLRDTILDRIYTQSNRISDTLIEGNIVTYINPLTCEIMSQNFDYKPKFPIIVKEYVTIEKTIEKTLSNKKTFNIGGGLTVTNKKDIGVLGVYQFPNLIQIQGGYTWDITKDLNTVPKNNTLSVSIIKLF